jgi:hypothetical protein
MWLVGSCYNFLWAHRSLGERLGEECTPAIAAGLTDHRWSMEELLTFPVVPAELPTWRSGGSLGGYWKPSVQPDHGSMWRYLRVRGIEISPFDPTHCP